MQQQQATFNRQPSQAEQKPSIYAVLLVNVRDTFFALSIVFTLVCLVLFVLSKVGV